MQIFIGKKLAIQQRLPITRQKGISLVPALITICIFTLLTSQVIIPNQIRNTNEAFIKSIANSAEKLEQASLAFYAKNGSWPQAISNLIPDFLPIFNEVTDTGYSWQIVEVLTDWQGALLLNNTSGFSGPRSSGLLIQIGDHKLAEAVVNKIGAHAVLTTWRGFNPRYPPSDENDLNFVLIPLLTLGTTTVDNLNITGNFELGSSTKPVTFEFNGTDITTDLEYLASKSNSSKRFKQNIHPLETQIESIYQLKPVTYNYKDTFKQYKTPNAANNEIGLIAEQVLPLIPEITLVDDDNKVMGIDYPKLSILLLSAIQELKAEVTTLKVNNQQLQDQMDSLNIEGEGLNIQNLRSANINKARTDHGTD